jgi:hypothetical protein
MTGTLVEQEFGAPRVRVEVRRGPLAVPVLVRAIAMFAARTSLPATRLDDICDVLEAIAVSLPGDRIAVEARADRGGAGLQLHVSGLAGGTARSVLSDVRHGGLARLLTVTSDGVAVRSSTTRGESLVVTFAPPR